MSHSLCQLLSAETPAHSPWISASHDVCLHTYMSEMTTIIGVIYTHELATHALSVTALEPLT